MQWNQTKEFPMVIIGVFFGAQRAALMGMSHYLRINKHQVASAVREAKHLIATVKAEQEATDTLMKKEVKTLKGLIEPLL